MPHRCACTTSVGRRRPAKPTGHCVRCSLPRRSRRSCSNTAYYKNELVDGNIAKALNTTDAAEKEKLYKAAQKQIWDDAPWAFLVTEKVLYARAKNLSGIYVMPDGSFNFDAIELK